MPLHTGTIIIVTNHGRLVEHRRFSNIEKWTITVNRQSPIANCQSAISQLDLHKFAML